MLPWVYFAGWECSKTHATPGKMLLGLQVLDKQGKGLSFAKASSRFWLKPLTLLSMIPLLTDPPSLWEPWLEPDEPWRFPSPTEYRHDVVTETQVVLKDTAFENQSTEVLSDMTDSSTPAEAPSAEPLDLNQASKDQLLMLPVFNAGNIDRFIAARVSSNGFTSWEQVQALLNLPNYELKQLKKLVHLPQPVFVEPAVLPTPHRRVVDM